MQVSFLSYCDTGLAADSPYQALRVEWARSRARALRWWEEVGLLTEEMRRSVEYCSWLSLWWEKKMTARGDVEPALAEGLRSYAHEHMLAEQQLGQKWLDQWSTFYNKATLYMSSQSFDSLGEVPIVEVDLTDPPEE